MRFEFEFGRDRLALEAPSEKVAGEFRGPEAAAEYDVEAELRAALARPLDAPEFARAFVPGDHVGIAIDADLPQAARIAQPILEALVSAGVEPADVSFVRSREGDDWRTELPESLRTVNLIVADPEIPDEYAYLASTDDGRRVYLPRALADADTMLAVGVVGPDWTCGAKGPAATVFPGLADTVNRTRSRHLSVEGGDDPKASWKRQSCGEVAWLAGMIYGVAVAIDRDGKPEKVWAGAHEAVQKAAEEHVRSEWTPAPPKNPADLVVAALSPGKIASWRETADAAVAAARLAGPDGAVAVLSDLDEKPGESLSWLRDGVDPPTLWARLRSPEGLDAEDAAITAAMLRVLASTRLYLKSRLPAEMVEEMGIVPFESGAELENLLRQRRRCYLISAAERIWS